MTTATTDLPELSPAAPISPIQRVLAIFSTPSRAFLEPGLAKSWWLPFLLVALVSLGFAGAIESKVGWDTVVKNNLADSPKQQARIDQLPADQQQQQYAMIGNITKISSFAGFVVGPLIFAAVAAGVLLASLNFVLGGHARFGSLYSVYFYSAIPSILKLILASGLLLLGFGTETFQLKNPLGSNVGYYLAGMSLPAWVVATASWIDVFLIWQIVLVVIGCAMVAKVSMGKAAAVVCGWVVLGILVTGGFSLLS